MKYLICVFILIFCSTLLFSQTTIPGGFVSGTWDLIGSPYLIEGKITIPDGQTLTIDPGCLVEFQEHYKFNVQGRLLAEGTEQDSIRFTVADTTGFYTNEHTGWHGIRFDNTPATNDSSRIVYCHLEYGKAIGTDWRERSGGAVYVDDFSKILISNCKLINNYANSSGGAIHDGGGILIDNSIISNNLSDSYGGGIGAISCLTISNSLIKNNTSSNGSGVSVNGSSCQMTNLIIQSNNGEGIYIENNSVIINCKITNNQYNGIRIENSSPKIINSLVCNNGNTGISIYEIQWQEASPKINNCTIANNEGYGISHHVEEFWPDITTNNIQNMNKSKPNRAATCYNNIITGNYYGSIHIDNTGININYSTFSDYVPSFAGIGCISTEPHFVDPTAGVGVEYNALEANWSLQSNSMCIDHGTPDTTGLYLPEFDLAEDPRVFQGNIPRIDIGAYEFQGEPDMIPDIYVYPHNFNFGLCTVDEFSLEKSFMISNIGFDNLNVTSIIAPEGFLVKREDDLEFGSSIDQFTIETDSMETINIIFNPITAIIYSGNIVINSNDPDEVISTVGVTGIGDIYPVVYGNISEDTIWDSEIIKVTGNITVDNGKTLTITPGTNINIMGSFTLNIQGRILAEGTQQDTIFFTSKDSNSWWSGIKFDETSEANEISKFSFCEIEKSSSYFGAAFYINDFSKINISHCKLTNNEARSAGGAIYGINSNIIINNTIFNNNVATGYWDWEWFSPGYAGGLFFRNSNIELRDCIIYNNLAFDDYESGSAGGGIYIYNSEVLIQNSQLSSNLSSIGAGIFSYNSNIRLINCELNANGSQAISLSHSTLDLINSIISLHNNDNSYTITASDSTNISFINTIMYDNEGQNVRFYPSDNTFYADYSCIEGGENSIIHVYNGTVYWEENNIEDDPFFIDPENGDFHLQSGSPCINTGTPSGWIIPSFNIPINELLGYDSFDNNYDMGCYEYQEFMIDQNEIDFGEIPYNTTSQSIQITITNVSDDDMLITSIKATDHFLIKQNIEDEYADQIGSIELIANSETTFWIACHPLEKGLLEGEISIYTNAIPSRAAINVYANVTMVDVLKLYNNFPNPFNPETTIRFSIPQESKVELIIYNIKGQKVKTLVEHICEMGINTVVWNGTNDSGKQVSTGVYFYKLNVEGKTIKTKKMLLLK